MSVTLRPLIPDNLSDCLLLEVSDQQRNHAQIEETPDMIEAILADTSFVSLTIYNDNTMVGLIVYAPVAGTSDYQIHRFFIDEKHQGHGYGDSALRQVIKQLSHNTECERIVISYMSFNEPAAYLYEKLGFLETDEFQESEDLDKPGSRFAVYFCSPAALKTEGARRQRRVEQLQAQVEHLQAQLDQERS